MVNIPFLNIEIGQIHLASIIPELITMFIRVCTKTVDAAVQATHPVPEEIEEAYVDLVLQSFPREIQKVFKRGAEGKHRNEDQLSSELEDAALDYYRRMIRTAVVGATDEDQEDLTVREEASRVKRVKLRLLLLLCPQAYKVGLDRPSAQADAWANFYADCETPASDPAEALSFEGTPEERQAIQAALEASQQWLEEVSQRAQQHEAELLRVRSRLRSRRMHSAGTAANAGIGLAVGVAVVKGLALLVLQLRRLKRPKSKKAKKAKAPAAAASKPATERASSAKQPGTSSAKQPGTSAAKQPVKPSSGKAAPAGEPQPQAKRQAGTEAAAAAADAGKTSTARARTTGRKR